MKTSATLILAAAALASAQVDYDPNTGVYTCDRPNVAYCSSDIIIRCDADKKGTPGRCSANVSGQFPPGGIASCYETSKTAGDAACVKNCVVYADEPFTLPADVCTPSATPSSSVVYSTTYTQPSGYDTESPPPETKTTTYVYPTGVPPSSSEDTESSTIVYPTASLSTFTTTYVYPPLTSSATHEPPKPSNGTYYPTHSSSTRPPASTTTGPPTIPPNAASGNQINLALAGLGLIAAYLL